MNERVMQFRVGVMVVAAVLFASVIAVLFGGVSSPFRKTYTIYVKFPSAPGISTGSAVRRRGIRIGQVSNVTFSDDDQVLVTLQLDASYRINQDEPCCLKNSLLGDAWLEFEPPTANLSKPGSPLGLKKKDGSTSFSDLSSANS